LKRIGKFVWFYSIFLALTGTSHALGAGVCALESTCGAALLRLIELGSQLEKRTQIDLANEEPAQFCQTNMLLRFLNVNPRDSAAANFVCTDMSCDVLERYANATLLPDLKRRAFDPKLFQEPWAYSLIQTDMAQDLAFADTSDLFWRVQQVHNLEGLVALATELREKALTDFEQTFSEKNKKDLKKITPDYLESLVLPRDSSSLASSVLAQGALCADLKLSEAWYSWGLES